ncbi:unnamed protein product [Moneuplotes crassus]|uniref:Uncharacterized protein n=1 Tax=Euplotes crassus TaxID=5936 RepID=A0AAD1XY68_EUPCR|nr:unnamed protein product [Moneuplotes crassus]
MGEVPLACANLLMLIAISVLYEIGKEETCGINAEELIFVYIIIKSSFIFLRIPFFLGAIFSNRAGMKIYYAWNALCAAGMTVFYIIILVNFFDSGNNCKHPAANIWTALLLVTIEGITSMIILIFGLCFLAYFLAVVSFVTKKTGG